MHTILARAKEPSTLAGLSMLAVFLRLKFPAYAPVLDSLAAVLGGGAVVLPERGGQ
jgi:hypothetical protein